MVAANTKPLDKILLANNILLSYIIYVSIRIPIKNHASSLPYLIYPRIINEQSGVVVTDIARQFRAIKSSQQLPQLISRIFLY